MQIKPEITFQSSSFYWTFSNPPPSHLQSRQLLVQQWHVVIKLRLVVVAGNRFAQLMAIGKSLDRELGTIFTGTARNKIRLNVKTINQAAAIQTFWECAALL